MEDEYGKVTVLGPDRNLVQVPVVRIIYGHYNQTELGFYSGQCTIFLPHQTISSCEV